MLVMATGDFDTIDPEGLGSTEEADTPTEPGDAIFPDANPRKAVIGGVAFYALCWMQPGPGQLSTCDRVLGHEGGHSWEIGQ
jgi:hypothetical protein